MSHDPERLAAAYLTTMPGRARSDFEEHLLACDACWREVSLSRRGRQLAETARDIAPARLREDIRAAVAARPAGRPQHPRRSLLLAATALAAFTAIAVLAWPRPASPPGEAPAAVIAAAFTSYQSGQLPGTAIPAVPAPSLTALRVRLTGAASGQLDGVTVTMFAYRTPAGVRLIIIVGDRPFPEASQARELGGAEGAWTMRSAGITLICARDTHATLLLSTDPALVQQAGALLNAI